MFAQPAQDILCQLSVMGAGFHYLHRARFNFAFFWSIRRGRSGLEPFDELECEQFTKQGTDAHARVKISSSAGFVLFLFIISINGTIKSELHEAGKGDWPSAINLPGDIFCQLVQLLAVWCGFS